MRYIRNVALAAVGIMLLTAASAIASAPPNGSDGSLEWRTVTSMELPAKDFVHSGRLGKAGQSTKFQALAGRQVPVCPHRGSESARL